MTDFKNLEERYNYRVNPPLDSGQRSLYSGAKTKFAGGRPSIEKSDDPIIVRAPGESQKGINSEDRSKPFVSAPNDTERLKRYLSGPKGIQFLLKQQLLQTGNTFSSTRIINPLFILGNTTPFVHTRRSLRPISVDQTARSLGGLIGGRIGSAISFGAGLVSSLGLGRPSNDITNLRKSSQLQQETYNKLKSTVGFTGISSDDQPSTVSRSLGSILGSAAKSIVNANIKKILTDSPFGKTITAFTSKRSMGEVDGGWVKSRPELESHIPTIMGVIKEYQQNRYLESVGAGSDKVSFLEYFERSFRSDIKDNIQGTDIISSNKPISVTGDRKGNSPNTYKPRYYIKDQSNIPTELLQGATIPTQYQDLPLKSTGDANDFNFADPINVSLATGKNNHVQFRAFIKDLKLTSTPEYKTYQYIGRIEKFVNYAGVQREANFKLSVIAFSPEELNIVWKRINYLTGMVFPYGFTRGILQPNIVRLTIGNVFNDQPGYITALDTDFQEVSETWEINNMGDYTGRQVPIAATLNMRFVIIEKNTKVSTSPFFAITGDVTKTSATQETNAPGTPEPRSVESRNSSATFGQATNAINSLNNSREAAALAVLNRFR